MKGCEVEICGIACSKENYCLLLHLLERLKKLEDQQGHLSPETITEYILNAKKLLEENPDCQKEKQVRVYLVARRLLPEAFATTRERFDKLEE